ncbi:MAG: VOC family protein [Anaerolineales bacterium]|uniref:VOC family protein n=1 Tax=Candidatus Desulfolinea nitratireducens TaxID=2841698 RepID=A0A8J6NMU0_9CHLR|nr:VOC family protein [Candidatus Desulfolinea nitratireducens]MBL6959500.1 VOC family protein [Anaerolineales bacterium]
MSIKFVHTNLIAKDWKRLSAFYQEVFECVPAPPERDHSGEWLDRVTGLKASHIRGIHLRLPGCGEAGPTLEIFSYNSMPEHPSVQPNTPGFSHVAFIVDDVGATAQEILNHGGSAIGELAIRDLPGVGLLTFQYLADPEGNIVEIQNWKKPDNR